MIAGFMDFALPPLCLGCGKFNEDGSCDVCERCMKKIGRELYPICLNCSELIPNSRECLRCKDQSFPLFAYGVYRDPLSEIILQFKFRGITSPASLFSRLICEQFGKIIIAFGADWLVPVPLHRGREKFRGYNQARLIAEQLSEGLNIAVGDEFITKIKRTRPQSRLEISRRKANVHDAFRAAASDVTDDKLILVDDVATSGATLREVRRTLVAAKGNVVAAVVFAHGHPGDSNV